MHIIFFDRGLNSRLAIYGHSVEEKDYSSFKDFVQCFKQLGYQFCAPDQYFIIDDKKKICLSFDDNYKAWYKLLHLLDELDIRSTFYVNTLVFRDRASNDTIADYFRRLVHKGKKVPLSTDELKSISNAGHFIGAHSHSHQLLSQLNPSFAEEEIRLSKDILEELLGKPIAHFSYPFGMRRHFNVNLQEYCLGLGFQTIATAIPGMQHVSTVPPIFHRTPWLFDKPLAYNLTNIRIDGQLFEKFTGRSAVG